jgi:hypothetical protein
MVEEGWKIKYEITIDLFSWRERHILVYEQDRLHT